MDTIEQWVENCAPVVRGGMRVFVALCCVGGVLALASMCAGCGDAHATLALTLRDGSDAAREAILDARGAELRRAGSEAQTSGGDVGAAIDAAAASWDAEHTDALEAQALAAEASTAYTAAALAHVSGRESDVEDAARAAIRALNRVLEAMTRHGFPDVPEIPESLAGFIAALVGGAQ